MISTSHEVIRKGSAEELIGHRNRALEYYRLGLDWIAKAFEAQILAAPGSYMPETLCDRYALSYARGHGEGGDLAEFIHEPNVGAYTIKELEQWLRKRGVPADAVLQKEVASLRTKAARLGFCLVPIDPGEFVGEDV